MNKYAIIVAGGTGSRMGVTTPKQFLLLAGKPILMYSLEAFFNYDPEIHIILAIHPGYQEEWGQLCQQHFFTVNHQVISGGETRFHSVRNALLTIPGDGLVAVHDAARPVVSVDLIARSFDEAALHGNAIPGIPVNETVRSIQNDTIKLLDRTSLRIIQTPQTFEIGLLKAAYMQDYQPGFTDDASLLEMMGKQIYLFPGDPGNIKITLPGDIQVAELHIAQSRKAQ
jgi:2-C-methyl-D-erythritol 4-phosphate cytidylyltransferase